MMNEFGTPMTDADINMSSNPAKAMLNEQLATGMDNNIVGALIAGAVGLYGAKKSSDAAKDAQRANNAAAAAQYKYNVQRWEMD